MDFFEKQRLRQELAVLMARLEDLDCDRIMLEKEIQRLKDEIGDEQ